MFHDSSFQRRGSAGSSVFCFAHGSESGWEATCIDFDIAVQGDTFEEVKRDLEMAVRSYVLDACQEDDRIRDRLLSRRAPWHVRAKVGLILAVEAMSERNGKRQEITAGFPLPCHA